MLAAIAAPTRRASARPAARLPRWLRQNAATTKSKLPSRNGSATASAATGRPRGAPQHALGKVDRHHLAGPRRQRGPPGHAGARPQVEHQRQASGTGAAASSTRASCAYISPGPSAQSSAAAS